MQSALLLGAADDLVGADQRRLRDRAREVLAGLVEEAKLAVRDGQVVVGLRELSERGTYARTFDAAGRFDYGCEPHPFMRGAIVVDSRNGRGLFLHDDDMPE